LRRLSPVFEQMYPRMGRPSIPPEHLLEGCLLMCLYSIRSERQLCERLRYDMLFRCFLDLQVDGPTFDPSGFAHNRDRLLQADVARLFFDGVLREAKRAQLISKEHFTVGSFGWMKTIGGLRKLRYRGTAKVRSWTRLLPSASTDGGVGSPKTYFCITL
jgi:Transposase domain (DUF772)